MTASLSVAGRVIENGGRPFVIAELSGNHNGDLGRALALIDAAREAGADAVKFQTYTADTITIDHAGPEFTISGGPWHGRRLHELYREASTPWEWHESLFERAAQLGLIAFSTPFDPTAVAFLEGLNVPIYKIASFEIIDLPLLRIVARTGKPAVISTGMANLAEISEAVEVWRESTAAPLCLLHCVSAYPAPIGESNLRTIPHLAAAFDVVSGLSDHTPGIAASVAAVALGAGVIEKHITLRRADGGPDAAFSLEPDEFRALAQNCRDAHAALGQVSYSRTAAERGNLQFRRSLYAVADIAAGEMLTHLNVRSIRPGNGLLPKLLPDVLGRRAAVFIPRGTALDWALLS